MIEIKRFTYSYPGASTPVLRDLSLTIDEGEFVLVTGASGAGKSTFLRALNGLVPHFTGGTCAGQVRVAGHDALLEGPQVLSRYVGFVFQDPEAQFVVDRVEDEVAFALEQQAVPPPQMHEQVQGALALLGLLPLRDRPLDSLSGGERQRVALAAALALRPRLLVLDEPTSQLDPQAAHDLLGTLVRMNRDLGITVVLAEHRLERVLQYADRLVHLTGPGGPVLHGTPREVLPAIDLAPPVVTLGKALGWSPLPLSVSEALPMARATVQGATTEEVARPAGPTPPSAEAVLTVRGLAHGYGGVPVLRGVDLDVRAGELVALLGPNGAGKTTLLRAMVGLLRPEAGDVRLAGRSTSGRATAEICAQVAYLPQQPDDLLFADTVREELEVTLRNHGLLQEPPVAPEDLLARLGLAALSEAYPRDLSVGQRQRVALAAVTVTRPPLLLLDEPTRGMDYGAKQGLVRLLRGWQDEGSGVLMVTHDVELAAAAADRVLLLDGGRIVAEGPPARVLSGAERFAPHTAQLFPGRGWLTPEAALRALRRVPGRAAAPPA